MLRFWRVGEPFGLAQPNGVEPMLIRPISERSIGALPRYPSPHPVSFVPPKHIAGAGAVSRLAWPNVKDWGNHATGLSATCSSIRRLCVKFIAV